MYIEKTMNFLLLDRTDHGGRLAGLAVNDPQGVRIHLDGYGDGGGAVVMLELLNGVPRVVVYASNLQDEPTHVIELDLAAESRRPAEVE